MNLRYVKNYLENNSDFKDLLKELKDQSASKGLEDLFQTKNTLKEIRQMAKGF